MSVKSARRACVSALARASLWTTTGAPGAAQRYQRWIVLPSAGGSVTLQQLSSRRFLDAHPIEGKDFALVTRPEQDNDSPRWLLAAAGTNTVTLRQRSSDRFVDAHEIASKDFAVVTRPEQNNDTLASSTPTSNKRTTSVS